MTGRRAIGLVRRLLPQTVRLRLALLYAGLFLAAGAVLLALTYGLVASSLSTGVSHAKFTAGQLEKLKSDCTAAQRNGHPKGKEGPYPVKAPTSCLKLETAGAAAAIANQRAQVLGDLLTFSLIGLGVLTVCSGGIGWLMAGRVLRPVTAITGAARRASEHHFGERLNLTGPDDELKELADTFDVMLGRLDTAFASQRRFVADASHELRTPLTLIRTAIDVTLTKPTRSPEQMEAMAIKVRRWVDRAESLVDALLTLAVSERELTTTEEVDLATVTEDALDAVERAITTTRLHVETELAEAPTRGDSVLLERLASNLVDNAIRHNRTGGWVHVATGMSPAGRTYLRVSNGGDIVPPELVESLFEPFRTVQGRAGNVAGFGLGLAIVKSIASAHDGLVVASARPGGGLEVTVEFPPSASDPSVPSDRARGTLSPSP